MRGPPLRVVHHPRGLEDEHWHAKSSAITTNTPYPRMILLLSRSGLISRTLPASRLGRLMIHPMVPSLKPMQLEVAAMKDMLHRRNVNLGLDQVRIRHPPTIPRRARQPHHPQEAVEVCHY